ncbi:hypothetical protein [Streptomyces adelaidensis]|uniref:hypothetical protein n=1 Tax=Streptomyces adelaidensis TaxID=2796465 RepID=UPI0027DD2FBC|nr:hypothetical protein [Streptomyces adelaidensis]
MGAGPERAEAAFDAISEAGRDAMTQLRRMLGVPREGGGEGQEQYGAYGAGVASREPQPGVGD